ncbi:hypothetical protein CDD80_4375 [Ophiocordyceps camponoti-rufipedis]|uniref:Patatin-like phospholipase domain-containing protein n=1 Tax=Ophiocordyceps camponoti-rufipedis TaxID=2004952 RepID=A0A2C5YYW1_9HYPO|nr:hypothetical protein CDD80_4375 [Ophiocordyceps camponoti-rufipedis]
MPKLRYGFPPEAFEPSRLPDVNTEFTHPDDFEAFAKALAQPDHLPTMEEEAPAQGKQQQQQEKHHQKPKPPPINSSAITKRFSVAVHSFKDDASAVAAAARAASGDSQPLETQPTAVQTGRQESSKTFRKDKFSGKCGTNENTKTKDETGEGTIYQLTKWPLLIYTLSWLAILSASYFITRTWISTYEYFMLRGSQRKLRKNMRRTSNYREWVAAAKELDCYLGGQSWREENSFAYYNWKTVKRVWDQMRDLRTHAEHYEATGQTAKEAKVAQDLRALIEACVKYNFVGVDNPRLYSHTYYGTKNLVQNFIDESELSKKFLLRTKEMSKDEKHCLFKQVNANYGRTALCLSGGASCAYYHIGVVRSLVDADVVPNVITGTSGGALIASLVGTRTNDELKQLLIPALAERIKACQEPISVWGPRWWNTGARFDLVDWAGRCSWFTRGSLTFREAYERTGRILNVSCVPTDPHSPTMICNYLTSPDCVVWSAVLASAAVPGVLNPVVLMTKRPDGTLTPWAFGHRWRDGSIRNDIPIKALNTLFNVNFTIVSQVNPHINFFFFSSRGSIGNPTTHRKGRGWRGGFLTSAFELYLKLEMNKWLKFIRYTDILPRAMGQDWSKLWLQGFGGNITILPQPIPTDFLYILSDPDPFRLARMMHEGRQSAFPKLKFIANRLKVSRLIEKGRQETRPWAPRDSLQSNQSDDDLANLTKTMPTMPMTPLTPMSVATPSTVFSKDSFDNESTGTAATPIEEEGKDFDMFSNPFGANQNGESQNGEGQGLGLKWGTPNYAQREAGAGPRMDSIDEEE